MRDGERRPELLRRGFRQHRLFEGSAERTIDVPGDPRFVERALAPVEAPPGHYVFRDLNPVSLPGKPGFGASAAACVAAVLAGLRHRGEPPPKKELYGHTFAAHCAVQGGGSGADVAASAYGGCLWFEGGLVSAAPRIEPVVVWSGRAAETVPRIARYQAWRDREAFVAETRALARAFFSEPVRVLEEARKLLEDAAESAGIDYMTPALARIADLAGTFGGAVKPSGAGGGDSAVAFFADLTAEAAFRAACEREGFCVIPVHVAPAEVA